MVDWTTSANLATAGGTALLAVATFFSTRSANTAARSAERGLLDGLRPILVPSRWEDPVQKVHFMDERWIAVSGGRAVLEIDEEAAYLVLSLRNVGRGVAILHGWDLISESLGPHRDPDAFHRLTRDIFVPPADNGFCQVAVREPGSDRFKQLADRHDDGERFSVDVLYSDVEGGQRIITRMGLSPAPARHGEETGGSGRDWAISAARHWNLDRADPR
jgi:hypothetical protein